MKKFSSKYSNLLDEVPQIKDSKIRSLLLGSSDSGPLIIVTYLFIEGNLLVALGDFPEGGESGFNFFDELEYKKLVSGSKCVFGSDAEEAIEKFEILNSNKEIKNILRSKFYFIPENFSGYKLNVMHFKNLPEAINIQASYFNPEDGDLVTNFIEPKDGFDIEKIRKAGRIVLNSVEEIENDIFISFGSSYEIEKIDRYKEKVNELYEKKK